MLKTEMLKGIIVPLFTPLTWEEDVDPNGLRSLVRYVLEGGVHSIFVNGSAGEFPLLTSREKGKIIELVVKEVNGEVPVLVGVGECGTKKVLENINIAYGLGANFAVVPPPYYYAWEKEGLRKFYLKLAEKSSLPLLIYSNPHDTGVCIPVGLVKELSTEQNIVGIKESSADIARFQEIYMATRNNREFQRLAGNDNNLAAGLFLGADGAVPSTANIAPHFAVKLYEAIKQGDHAKAREFFGKILLLMEACYGCKYLIGGAKTALELMGICSNAVASPLILPSAEERQFIKVRLQELELI